MSTFIDPKLTLQNFVASVVQQPRKGFGKVRDFYSVLKETNKKTSGGFKYQGILCLLWKWQNLKWIFTLGDLLWEMYIGSFS